jgi:pyruvate/2-oxoglutarate/acetoin dehydrogenase E1 component
MKYLEALTQSMAWLSQQPGTVFLGQNMADSRAPHSRTLAGVPEYKIIDLPIAEELQMGMTLGMSLNGTIPISIFPRWNFMLCAINQLINHVDKLPIMGNGFGAKSIIRTAVGADKPIDPQCQHTGNFTIGLKHMCSTLEIIELYEPSEILPAYQWAYQRTDNRSTLLVEFGNFYQEK